MRREDEKVKILSVVGARPNFMKIASIARAVDEWNASASPAIEHVIVHTGQHYDEKMSKLFFEELGIPKPKHNLEVGSGSHAVQTAEIIKRIETVLLSERPDWVVVVGDVNSTIAAALVASKLGQKIAHVEAGLRSFDRSMPEEVNRVLTDAISDILFVTERSGIENLLKEGVPREKILFVGNVMIDTLLAHLEKAKGLPVLEGLGLKQGSYGVLTLHRPSNVDDSAVLKGIMGAISEFSKSMPVLFPVHPRTRKRISESGIGLSDNIILTEPFGYLEFLKLLADSRLVLTDSGGIQEETTVLGVPCLTLRENTERPVTITEGTNRLVGIKKTGIVSALRDVLEGRAKKGSIPELWDGMAGKRIIEAIISENAAQARG